MTPEERAMRCAPCGTINYPRIAPCIIVLVTRGEELLLAQNVNHPQGMFSTLAGFIEAGEIRGGNAGAGSEGRGGAGRRVSCATSSPSPGLFPTS